MYISGGENVYPAEIESILMAHSDIREVAVIGVADQKWGEVGCAIIATISGEALELSAVHALCEGNLARFKWPQHVVMTDALPRNSTGAVPRQCIGHHDVLWPLKAREIALTKGMYS